MRFSPRFAGPEADVVIRLLTDGNSLIIGKIVPKEGFEDE